MLIAQVLVSDPKELEKIRDRESDITKERIQKVQPIKDQKSAGYH